MTSLDKFNLPITGADQTAASGYDQYVDEYLRYGANLRDYFLIADAYPGAPLIQAHAAALHMAFEGAEGWAHAAPYLNNMNAHEKDATARERLFCQAVNTWNEKDFSASLAILDELTVRWPGDLCAAKWGQYHAFNLGDQAALLRFGKRTQIVHEKSPYAHGMIAFAMEQNHQLRAAEEEGMRAVEIAIDDAWAHHAVAHVLETEGRSNEGRKWMQRCAHTWEGKGLFIREHNWWHTALFDIALGHYERALDIYDRYLWGEWPEFPQEQIGAISLLWRLEMRGVEVGERWSPVLEQARARAGEHIFPFHDLHYLYAIARAGNDHETDKFLTSMTNRANDNAPPVWSEICVPTAKSLVSYTRGDNDTARGTLAPLMDSLHRIGGSHAQRHVFTEMLEHCDSNRASRSR